MKKAIIFLLRGLIYLFVPLVAHADNDTSSCRSVAESMKTGVFVQACRIVPTEIVVNGSRVEFKEAWVERLSRVTNWLGIIPKRKIIGTTSCLLISLTGPSLNTKGFTPGLWKLRNIKYPIKGMEDSFFWVISYRDGSMVLKMPLENPQDQYEIIIVDKYKGEELGLVNIVKQ